MQIVEVVDLGQRMDLVAEDGDQILVEHFLLFVGHGQESLVGLVQVVVREGVAEFLRRSRSPWRPVRAVSTTRLSEMPTCSGSMIS